MIGLLAFILGRFVIHQPLVIILGLLDTEIAGHGVHGDEWIVEPYVQASQRLTQGIVFLNYDCRGLGLRQYHGDVGDCEPHGMNVSDAFLSVSIRNSIEFDE